MAKSEYEVHHDSNVCWPSTALLRKKPTEVGLPDTRRWRHFRVAKYIVFIMCLPIARCVLVEKPLNEAVMVGSDPVKFKCKTDLRCRLRWFTHQSQSNPILFSGYSVSKEAESYCTVENGEPGKFYLKLTATPEAAQTYICFEPGTNKESSADLIVIGRESLIETITNDSYVIMTCYVEFCGNWAPELEWSYNGTLITEGVNISIVSNKSVSSTLTVPLSENDRSYTCTTRFDIKGKPPWTTSDNVPDYVSDSVLTVKANLAVADKPEAQLSVSGTSMVLVIGIIIIALATITSFAGAIVFIYRRAGRNGCRNEEASDVEKPLATKPQASVEL